MQEQDAQDIVMEVFEKLWEQFEQFQDEKSCKAYLYISVKGKCLRKINKRQHEDVNGVDIADDRADAEMVRTELVNLIYDEIKRLPANRRKMVELYLNGESTTRISNLLGITKNNLYVLTNRTIDQLSGKVKKYMP